MELLIRACRKTNSWVEYTVAALGIGMACIIAVQVFCRYILNASLFWSEELARYLLIWLTFLGATVAYFRGIHPGIDLVTIRLNRRLRKVCRIFVLLVSLGLFVVMIYSGAEFACFVRSQISPALAIPKWLIFAAIPVSGIIFLLHCLAFLVVELTEDKDDR